MFGLLYDVAANGCKKEIIKESENMHFSANTEIKDYFVGLQVSVWISNLDSRGLAKFRT